MKIRIIITIVVAWLGIFGAHAHAQDESLNRARDAFDAGQDLFEDGKFIKAAAQFQAAYEAKPFTQFLFNIGACYEKAKDYPRALVYYEKYLKKNPSDSDIGKTKERMEVLKKAVAEAGTNASSPDASAKAAAAVEKLDRVEIRGLVVIESKPSGADIYLDDSKTPLSKTPWNGSLSGQHKITIKYKGYKSESLTILPDASKILILKNSLAEEDYLGYLDITANVPGANIFIDDKSVGAKATTPWSGEIKPGKHKIWVTKPGFNEYATEIEVIAGETHNVKAKLEGAEVGLLNVRGNGVEKYKVFVDGKEVCERGPCIRKLSPGSYSVSIRRDGYRSYNQKIEVQSKTEVTMKAKLEEEPSRLDAYVTYAIAAAFVGGGYYLGKKSNQIKDDLKAEIAAGSPPPDSNDPRLGGIFTLKSGKNYAAAADVAYVAGAGTFLLAVYYTFRDKGRPSTGRSELRAISFEPTLLPNYAGFGLAGSF